MTRIFCDSEFTGLHQATSLISLALVSEAGLEFYAELTDYAREQCDEWIRSEVLAHTLWLSRREVKPERRRNAAQWLCCGDRLAVREELGAWLSGFGRVEVWGDVPAYDWVLFCELFGGARRLPEDVYYIAFDLATLFKARGLDPDTDREAYAGLAPDGLGRHNALRDARVLRACYLRLMKEGGAAPR